MGRSSPLAIAPSEKIGPIRVQGGGDKAECRGGESAAGCAVGAAGSGDDGLRPDEQGKRAAGSDGGAGRARICGDRRGECAGGGDGADGGEGSGAEVEAEGGDFS